MERKAQERPHDRARDVGIALGNKTPTQTIRIFTQPELPEESRKPSPLRLHPGRVLAAVVALAGFVSGVAFLAKQTASNPFTPWGLLVSVPGALLSFLALGSLYEWIVHRYLYHRPSKIGLLGGIYEIHQQGHHWRRFPPDRYVHDGPVERISVLPEDAHAVCGSPARRWIAWWGQFALYLAVGIPFVFVPAWMVTKNVLFTASAVLSGLVVCYLLIRVHDVMHYPANRWMERQAWFQFLDRHHYIHHIDNTANLNFLLPLCDLLFGTLRTHLTRREQDRWPSFEEAKQLLAVSELVPVLACILLSVPACGGRTAPEPVSDNYFSREYTTARTRFRKAAEQAGGRLTPLEVAAKGPGGEDLTIDIAWFGAEKPKRAFVHSSGLHGVEAFAGSAIELQWLAEGIPETPEDAAIVLVHVLNPYGMAWLRRFNERSVDLNRNFLGPNEEYSGAPEGFDEIDSFINPPTPPSGELFYLRTGWLILRHGMPTLKQTIAGGQYVNPKGLFFGGESCEEGPRKLQRFVQDRLADVERLVVMDVHTGLGPFALDTLLVQAADEDTPLYKTMCKTFGNRVASLEPKSRFGYRVKGAHATMYPRALPQADAYFVCQEFGPMTLCESSERFGPRTVGITTAMPQSITRLSSISRKLSVRTTSRGVKPC